MNLGQIQIALRSWVLRGSSGLVSPAQVDFGDQDNADYTATAPRVLIMLRNLTPVGVAEESHTYDSTAPVGEELTFEVKDFRRFSVDVQTFAPKSVRDSTGQPTALEIASRIAASAYLPSSKTDFNAAGLGLLSLEDVVRLPQVVSGRHEDSALVQATFSLAERVTEKTGYIATAEVTGTVTET